MTETRMVGPDDLDGCDALHATSGDEYDDDETAELRPLFPDGNADKAAQWRELFA